MLEEFEGQGLPKIVPAAFGKIEFTSTLDLSTWKPRKASAKKRRKLSICQVARARGVNRGLASFCYLREVRTP